MIALASAAAMLFVSGAAEIVDIWPVGSELGEVNDPADKPTLKVMLPPRKDGDMEPIQAVLQPGHES